MSENYEDLIDKTGYIYRAIVVASLRARQLTRRQKPMVDVQDGDKVIDVAVKEVCAGKVRYRLALSEAGRLLDENERLLGIPIPTAEIRDENDKT